jgi:hypothetical protein
MDTPLFRSHAPSAVQMDHMAVQHLKRKTSLGLVTVPHLHCPRLNWHLKPPPEFVSPPCEVWI